MGWDILTVGRHNLSFNDIESLATELHHRLAIDIKYGYDVSWRYNAKRNILFGDESSRVELGFCGTPTPAACFELSPDGTYDAYLLSQHFNRNAITPQFKHAYDKRYFRKDVKAYSPNRFKINNLCHDKVFFDILFINIYQECVEVSILTPFRWFGFVECAGNRKCAAAEKVDVLRMRQELKKIYHAFGRSEIYLFADQGPTEFIMDYYSKSWHELENAVNVGEFYDRASHQARQNGYEPYEKPTHFLTGLPQTLHSGPEYELSPIGVFVDDFSDL